jgi:hypothetical protein
MDFGILSHSGQIHLSFPVEEENEYSKNLIKENKDKKEVKVFDNQKDLEEYIKKSTKSNVKNTIIISNDLEFENFKNSVLNNEPFKKIEKSQHHHKKKEEESGDEEKREKIRYRKYSEQKINEKISSEEENSPHNDLHSFGVLNEHNYSEFIEEKQGEKEIVHIRCEEDFQEFLKNHKTGEFTNKKLTKKEIPHIRCEEDLNKFIEEYQKSDSGRIKNPEIFASDKNKPSGQNIADQIEIMKARNIAGFFLKPEMNVTKLTDKERTKFVNQMNHLESQLYTPENKLNLEMIHPDKLQVNISPEYDLKDMANLIQFNSLVKKHGIDDVFSHKCEDLLDLVHKRNIHVKNDKKE